MKVYVKLVAVAIALSAFSTSPVAGDEAVPVDQGYAVYDDHGFGFPANSQAPCVDNSCGGSGCGCCWNHDCRHAYTYDEAAALWAGYCSEGGGGHGHGCGCASCRARRCGGCQGDCFGYPSSSCGCGEANCGGGCGRNFGHRVHCAGADFQARLNDWRCQVHQFGQRCRCGGQGCDDCMGWPGQCCDSCDSGHPHFFGGFRHAHRGGCCDVPCCDSGVSNLDHAPQQVVPPPSETAPLTPPGSSTYERWPTPVQSLPANFRGR